MVLYYAKPMIKSIGFTLVELLIAVSVLAIIGAFGFAALVNYSRIQALENAARDLKTHLRLVQSKAMVQEKPAACSSSAPLTAYRLTFTNPSNYRIDALCSTTVTVGTFSLPQPITRTVPAADTYIDFLVSSGLPRPAVGYSLPFTFTLSGFSNTSSVIIEATGVIK